MQSINASLTLQHAIWAESIQAHPATAYLECGVVDLCEILFFLGGDPIFLARDGKAWPRVQNRRGAGHRNEKNGFEIGGGKGTKTSRERADFCGSLGALFVRCLPCACGDPDRGRDKKGMSGWCAEGSGAHKNFSRWEYGIGVFKTMVRLLFQE